MFSSQGTGKEKTSHLEKHCPRVSAGVSGIVPFLSIASIGSKID